MSEFNSYIQTLSKYITNENGRQLANELRLPLSQDCKSIAIKQNKRSIIEGAKSVNIIPFISANVNASDYIVNAIGHYVLSLESIDAGNYDDTFKHYHQCYNSLLDYYGLKDGTDTTWIVPMLHVIQTDLAAVAEINDVLRRNCNDNSTNTNSIREVLSTFQKAFSIVATDRKSITSTSPKSKKLAIFSMTNILLKLYFKEHTLNLSERYIRVVEEPTGAVMSNLQLFPVCQVVTYKYYVGRLRMFEDRYEDAIVCLRYALKYTPTKCLRNRQRILVNLIPMEMSYYGLFPTAEVGSKYKLMELVQLGNAAKIGDLRTFEEVMEKHQQSFLRIGVYLVLEQLKTTVYRSLFKRVYRLSDSTRLSLNYFQAALSWLGDTDDLDEIECILSNLIYQNKVKGYISHQKRFLILSKQDPFPVISIIKKAKV